MNDVAHIASLQAQETHLAVLAHISGYAAGVLQRAIELEVTAAAFDENGFPDIAELLRDTALLLRTGVRQIEQAIDDALTTLLSNNDLTAQIVAGTPEDRT